MNFFQSLFAGGMVLLYVMQENLLFKIPQRIFALDQQGNIQTIFVFRHSCAIVLWIVIPLQSDFCRLVAFNYIYRPPWCEKPQHLWYCSSKSSHYAALVHNIHHHNKHAGPHLSQANLCWSHLTIESFCNVHQIQSKVYSWDASHKG